jgi:hypothetical protein
LLPGFEALDQNWTAAERVLLGLRMVDRAGAFPADRREMLGVIAN